MGEHAEQTGPSPATSPQGRCLACGYDLRGSVSPVCPECGTPKEWRQLSFFESSEFQRAKLILEEAEIPVRAFDAGLGQTGLNSLYGGGMTVHEIGVPRLHLQKARTVLEAAGISVPAPFVDRQTPFCPACGERLDPDGPEACPHCGAAFCWSDQFEDEARGSSEPDRSGVPGRSSRAFTVVSRLMGLILVGLLSVVASLIIISLVSEISPTFWDDRALLAGRLLLGAIIWLFLSTCWVFRPMMKARKARAGR